MRQQILTYRVPSVAGPRLDGAKILKGQRMLERGSRGLQRQRRLADAARIVAQPVRQRNDRTTCFIVVITGKPEASLGNRQCVVVRRGLPQCGGKRQPQEYLNLARAARAHTSYAVMLVKLERMPEAIEL